MKESTSMVNYNLEPNESILIQTTGVLRDVGKIMTAYTDELVLTNQNIILVSQGMFGNNKGMQKFPLRDIKMANGEEQAILGKNARNGAAQLHLFFINAQDAFEFQNQGKKEVLKWADNINLVLTGSSAKRSSTVAGMAIPGTEFLAETLKGTIDTFRGTLGIKAKSNAGDEPQRVTTKCIGCRASVSGIKGQSIRCRYCDTEQNL